MKIKLHIKLKSPLAKKIIQGPLLHNWNKRSQKDMEFIKCAEEWATVNNLAIIWRGMRGEARMDTTIRSYPVYEFQN